MRAYSTRNLPISLAAKLRHLTYGQPVAGETGQARLVACLSRRHIENRRFLRKEEPIFGESPRFELNQAPF